MARDVEFNYTASDKTGTAASSVERRMRKTAQTVKSDSDKLSSDFAKNIVKLAEGVSPKLAKSLTSAFSSASEASGPLLIAGVAASAPLIGATLSAAIIGGAGLGGVIGGVLLAAKDPRVAKAGQDLGDKMLSALKEDAAPFIQPVLDAIGKISVAFDSERGKVQNIFRNSSRYLAPLVDGTLKAADRILDGIDHLVANAGPVMGQLGESIGSIGDHFGTFLSTVAGGGKGAALALKNITDAINGILTVAGPVIRGLTEIYYWLDKFKIINAVINPFLFLVQIGKQLADQYGITNAVMSKFATIADSGAVPAAVALATNITTASDKAKAAAGPIQNLTDKVDGLASSGRNLFDSTTNVAEAVDRFNQSVKTNGKTLDEHTAKGRENRAALSNLAGALTASYDAYVAVNGEGRGSNEVMRKNREAFIKAAQGAGFTRQEAEKLATQLGQIPAKKNTDFTANVHDAQGRIDALQDKIDGVHGKTVSVNVIVAQGQLNKVSNTLDRLNGGRFDALNSFAFAGPGAGTARTEAPRPVEVFSNVESSLYLDGSLIYGTTARQIRASSKRDAWRQKVGRR